MTEKERHEAIHALFREFMDKLMPTWLPERYPDQTTYSSWRAQVLSHISSAEYCAKWASDKLEEDKPRS